MKKILLLGSVVSPCPPLKQGGTERVAYFQAKHLARRGVQLIFVGAKGTEPNFKQELKNDKERDSQKILSSIDFVEIGGGTGFGNQDDALKLDPSRTEASRKLRLEMLYLAQVQEFLIQRKDEYNLVLNNMRGQAVLLPLAQILQKKVINVMHLNIFPELAQIFKKYQTGIIAISDAQRLNYPDLNYLATIYNPVSTAQYSFNAQPQKYALMIAAIGAHKNQKDAILACQKAGIKLILAGKIRDQDYFKKEIKPFIDDKKVVYKGEIGFEQKLKLYQQAKVFLFPILWQEPFGLVVIEALSCGTPVIAYPNGGPKEIIKNKETGFLVNSTQEMAKRISQISQIKREDCRKDVEKRFDNEVIGQQYYKVITKYLRNH